MANPVDRRQLKKLIAKPNDGARCAAERAAMAASRVADLAQNVASDVSDHSAKVKAISNDLAGIDRDSVDANTAVFAALDQMLAANGELQQRLEQAEKQLATQAAEIRAYEFEARTDSLTGLSNRRAFDDELKRRLSEWERKRIHCTLVLLDIDFFKKFNDSHGHQAGDEVLKHVAKVLKGECRDMDLPCRYGGEEFAVILPTTDGFSSCSVAERIRVAIESTEVKYQGKTLKVTCSLGVSQFETRDDVARLIRRSDEALYKSKEAGRNCGHWKNGDKCVPINAPVEELAEAVVEELSPAPDSLEARATSPGTFIQMLKRRATESHRYGIPLSVMHLKIEEFDIVLQKYGSAIARQLIDVASPAFEKSLRELDVLARLEHGEFVVMLPGKTQFDAALVARRMRSAINHCVLPVMDRQLQIAFRESIAELKPSETAQEILARARLAVLPPVAARKPVEV
jgi:diguanylate cyclase